MRILITGARGQLGSDLMRELCARGEDAVGVDLEEMDITDPAAVSRVLRDVRPGAVIHCAAWTAVDAAEEPENREKVWLVNAAGTENIARVCRELDCKMMYISTDYVFGGDGSAPWEPDCTAFAPLNVYGETKLAGEMAVRSLVRRHFIVRIAWVFGLHGGNFIKTMLRLGKTHPCLRVVNDQIGTPTYTVDLARLLADMIVTDRYGCYHATNEGGYISWADFAAEIFRQAGMSTEVTPVSTAEYGLSRARRPYNSRLDKRKLAENGFVPLPDWRDALARYLKELERWEADGTDSGHKTGN